jgi:hypothetical protein
MCVTPDPYLVGVVVSMTRQADNDPDPDPELVGAVRTLQRFVRRARPGRVNGDQARAIVALLAEAERAAASGIALYSPVVVESGSYAKEGHGSAADWLAAHSGSSAGVARGRLVAAERAAVTPELSDALHSGTLSSPQLKLLAEAAAVAPEAPGTLLDLVSEGSSHQELADAAARLRAAARSRECAQERRERVRAARHLRWYQHEEGGIRGEFLCDEVDWAQVSPGLEAEAKARWKAAGGPDDRSSESLDAHRLDAFLGLMGRSGRSKRPGSDGSNEARPVCAVLVDAEALRRGTPRGEELCEIDGIGPVSIDAVTELLGEGSAQFLLRSAKEIRSVTSVSRHAAQRLTMALLVRDRACAVPGCGKRLGLESDHREVDFAKGGETSLANLARLCAPHHRMKTDGGWRLEGRPGQWEWVAPTRPPTAGRMGRTRKVTMARAARNQPRLT